MIVVMYVVKVPNRGSPPAVLLRESYREDGKVKNRTLANLSSWPEAKVDALTRVLKGQPPPAAPLDEASGITRSLPHGHVAAVLGTARQLGLGELIDPMPSRHRDLVVAMTVAQVIAPDSKLAIARGLREETAASSLGEVLHLGSCDEDDLYEAMDYLHGRQEQIQDALAARHLAGGTLVLYDVSSAASGGRTCPLGAIGHPKDGVHGRLQIVYGLLTSPEGIPVAIEVFAGNTGDPTTVAAQVTRVKDRFGITKVVLVGDRGMLTAARLREDVRPAHLDWITALRAPQVKALVRDGDLQLTLFDQTDLAEITSPDFPGERLVACKNPFGEAERARKRESLLAATEADLAKIAAACTRARAPLRGRDTIAVRSPGTSPPRSPTTASATPATRTPSPRRPSSTASTCYAPASSPATWTAARSSPPTRPWPRSNGPSAPSIPTWTSGPSGTAPRTGSGRTCSCACCRTTSAGTCRPGSRRCCSPTTTSPPPPPPGPARSPRPPAPPAPWPRPPPSTPPATSRCTASAACLPTWPRSA
jgi:Transposase DDE domain